jgi:hypothetical protein
MMKSDYDVVVLGGGTAGMVAAIQAARAGASCLLVEKTALLGGTAIVAGVNFPGLFHAWGHQIIAGIGWELVLRAVQESGGELPDFRHDERRHPSRQVLVDRFTYAAVVDAAVRESGAHPLLHSMLVCAKQTNGRWELELACKEGLQKVTAHVLIDTSGDANGVSIAGFPIRRNTTLQPGTLIFRASGYDLAKLDLDAISQAARAAISSGELLLTDLGGRAERVRTLLESHGENIIHIAGIDARTSAGKTEAEFLGRAALLRLQRFLRQQPGLADFHVTYFAPECGIRETATIDGEVEVSVQDYTSGRLWEDAVCYSFYPIDIHVDHDIKITPLREGVYPTLPLRALVPKGSENLLAAGRIACGDKEAHSAFRVQASSMAMGQAVGALAALASQAKTTTRAVAIKDLHALLREHGAIVPELSSPDGLAQPPTHLS